jgi:hypothetical protein
MRRALPPSVGAALAARYGAAGVQCAEAYELCEYGRQPSRDELDALLPR